MKKKVVWLMVTGLMVAALLLASCAPAAVKEAEKVAPPVKEKEEVVAPKAVVAPEKKGEWVKWTGKKLDGTVVEKMIEKPRYGGVHIAVRSAQPTTFDRSLAVAYSAWNLDLANEPLLTRDWTRGPAGTGEWSAQFATQGSIGLGNVASVLAETWELPDAQTVVFRIRQGVHWALDPTSEASRLVGGRELNAEDVVHTLRREWTIGSDKGRQPHLADMKKVENSIYISPTDKWSVVMKTKPDMAWVIHERGNVQYVTAPEVIEKYGHTNDWKNVVGTGPFLLKEYVGASSLTYVRNPNYWQRDPFFPQNQLPYLDGVKVLIIPDASTRMAALRTGQIDNLYDLAVEDAEALLKTSPKLERLKYMKGSVPIISMRVDTKPFDDVRVRRALAIGTNRQELVDAYYKGEAELFTYPVTPVAELTKLYIPLQELPESVQELYKYNPDKAKKLLAEAGYPKGFKTEILVSSANTDHINVLQIINAYWDKIGVDLRIDIRDPSVYTSMRTRKTHTAMTIRDLSQNASQPFNSGYMSELIPGAVTNDSNVSDPWIWEHYSAVRKAMAADPAQGYLVRNRESIITRNDQVWVLPLPEPYWYVLWQRWLKGYYGAIYISHSRSFGYPTHVWLDQDLKKAMGR